MDTSGNVYVADTANIRFARSPPAARSAPWQASAGTNGLADGTGSAARFNAPQGLAVDTSGNVFVADTWNHTIRKVTSAGVVTTVAGLPGYYGNTDGTSLGAWHEHRPVLLPLRGGRGYVGQRLCRRYWKPRHPRSEFLGCCQHAGWAPRRFGAVPTAPIAAPGSTGPRASRWISAAISMCWIGHNHTIRLVAPVGTNWVVTTLAGMPDISGSADGTGNSARFFYPGGIGINNVGSLCVADWGNNTLRVGVLTTNTSPSIVVRAPASDCRPGPDRCVQRCRDRLRAA